jgi:hypothetical protein
MRSTFSHRCCVTCAPSKTHRPSRAIQCAHFLTPLPPSPSLRSFPPPTPLLEQQYATVDQKGQEHQKNLKELNDATKAHAKATLNVKIQTFKKGVRSDLAGDMVQNVLT